MKNIVFWKYKCPKCNKVIDDNDILLPLGGSILSTWNPKNYYMNYLHFYCSGCKAHLGFKWSTPATKMIAYQVIYAVLIIFIYNSTSLKNNFDNTNIVSAYGIGMLAIIVICYIVYSKKAKLEIIVDDIETRKKAESLEAKKIMSAEEDFGENEAVQYDLGHPDLDDLKEGILEIKDTDLLFKEQYKDKIYFTIPLKQISEVKTHRKLLSSSMNDGMASMGAEKNYLFVKFQKDGREHTAMFANTSYNVTSTILERLKYKIKYLKSTLDKSTLDNTTI